MRQNTHSDDTDAEQERLRGERLAAESERQRELDREQRAAHTWRGPGDTGTPPDARTDGGQDLPDEIADADEFETLDPTTLSEGDEVQVLVRRLRGEVVRATGEVVETGENPHVADENATLRLAPAGSVYVIREDDPFQELIGDFWCIVEESNPEDDMNEDDDGGEWDPQPASLREGETTDLSGHAQRNLEQISEAEKQGYLDEDEAEAARERNLDTEEGA